MTAILLFLMAYQVTGEALHEWIGMAEILLIIFHQILNHRWYLTLLKGKYNACRTFTAAIDVLLIVSLLLTAFCGMSMSDYALPFLYGMAPVSFVRRFHLSMSHWSFVLMGIHLGLHIPTMAAKIKLSAKVRLWISVTVGILSGYGLYLFIHSGMQDYLFFRVVFAFLDYEKAGNLVFLENLFMLLFFVFLGAQCAILCMRMTNRKGKKSPLIPVVLIMTYIAGRILPRGI